MCHRAYIGNMWLKYFDDHAVVQIKKGHKELAVLLDHGL